MLSVRLITHIVVVLLQHRLWGKLIYKYNTKYNTITMLSVRLIIYTHYTVACKINSVTWEIAI